MKLAKLAFKLPVSIFKEGKQYVAYTYALDLSTSGKSLEQAKARFFEAVTLLFEELVKKGTLERVLLELGWEKKNNKNWFPPVQISNEIETLALAV
ncbi:hypothetical protein HZA38_06580 [Candidatus Peregrinibacteria bacterium]|nr:hypothetical protein [Candidatus Peregrinibacteria bacterium]